VLLVGHFSKMSDEKWMALALQEASKGIGRTSPNPPVGAVIVRDGKLLSTGWHRKAGLAHAEVEAMNAARAAHGSDSLRGATAYVTLEPCSTVGKTPACTSGLIAAGISRVVYGCADPNPAHAGAADAVLEKAGLSVSSRVLEKECLEILRPFSKAQLTGLPWVIWKCAMSLDGKITRPDGEGQWLSGEESRADVQRLRSQVDGVITSGETARRDLPALTIRVPELLEGRSQPWRIVVTNHPESMPQHAPLFSDEWSERTLLRDGHDLEAMLRGLVKEQGVLSLMLEAGGKFSAAMLAAGLIDEIVIYQAPILCGDTLPAIAGSAFPASISIKEIERSSLGADLRIRGLIQKSFS
jgi:diaminohydroxyphosphoribosylaminopyrimidine deaminase/5-amino-6-(5-phosphoribosylamino)uracil reductase